MTGLGASAAADDDMAAGSGAADANSIGDGAWGMTSAGNLRITVDTGGFGAKVATSSSISRVDLPAAFVSTSSTFSVFKCGARSRNPVM
jgi:hypothetical protein